jgi:predicted acyl esterase
MRLNIRLLPFVLTLSAVVPAAAQDPPLREAHPGDDFRVREAMVPMRDGVKLYTLILTPKDAKAPLPILLERTPYDATRALSGTASIRGLPK